MTKEEIKKLIESGEGLRTEFKTCSEKLPKNLFESICAFLNTKGGAVLLGVSDSGEIVGMDKTKIPSFKREIANLSNNPQKLSPSFYLLVNEFDIDGNTILMVDVPESSQVHNTNNSIFVRNQDGDYKVTHPVEVARIVNRKQNYHTEQIIFTQVSFHDFRPDLIERAKHLIRLNNPDNHLWGIDNKEFLKKIGFYRKNEDNRTGYCLAAILFFCSDDVIQSFLPACKFEALLRKENVDRYDDRLTVRTNLLDAYDLLMSFIEKHLNDPFYLEGTTRISLRSKIFRELVANIISHREYMSTQAAFINIFNDRIEFANPNNPTVFGKIDPQNFTPVAKNPIINKLMVQMGRAEDIGSGIRNVTRYLPFYSKNASVVFIDGEQFSTIIQLPRTIESAISGTAQETAQEISKGTTQEISKGTAQEISKGTAQETSKGTAQETAQETTQETVTKIIEQIRLNPVVTRKELANIIGLSEDGIKYQLKNLKNQGVIKRVGPRKGGYWEIIDKE